MKGKLGLLSSIAAFTLLANVATAHAGQTIGSLLGNTPLGHSGGSLASGSPSGGGEEEGGFEQHRHRQSYVSVFAEALKISPIVLAADQNKGETILQIAKSKGISVHTLIARAESAYQKQLAVEVKKKHLSAANAKSSMTEFKLRIVRLISHNGPSGDGEHRHLEGGDDN